MIPSFFWACAPITRSWTDRGRTLWISEPARLLTVMSVTLTGTAHRLHLNLENQDACAAIRSSLRRSDLEAAFRDGVTVSREARAKAKREGKPFYEQERLIQASVGSSAARTSEEAREAADVPDAGLVWVDCETGGLSATTDALLEVAAIRTTRDGSVVIGEWLHHTVRPSPGTRCSAEALRINGHRPGDPAWIAAALDESDFVARWEAWCPRGATLAGHNVAFDERFLTAAGERVGRPLRFTRSLCTQRLAKGLKAQGLLNVGRLTLDALCEHFGLSNQGHHTARADTRRAIQVYRRLRALEQEQLPLAAGGKR